jgi:hypothetical protein
LGQGARAARPRVSASAPLPFTCHKAFVKCSRYIFFPRQCHIIHPKICSLTIELVAAPRESAAI